MILQVRMSVQNEQLGRLLPVFLKENADHVDRGRIDGQGTLNRPAQFFR